MYSIYLLDFIQFITHTSEYYQNGISAAFALENSLRARSTEQTSEFHRQSTETQCDDRASDKKRQRKTHTNEKSCNSPWVVLVCFVCRFVVCFCFRARTEIDDSIHFDKRQRQRQRQQRKRKWDRQRVSEWEPNQNVLHFDCNMSSCGRPRRTRCALAAWFYESVECVIIVINCVPYKHENCMCVCVWWRIYNNGSRTSNEKRLTHLISGVDWRQTTG